MGTTAILEQCTHYPSYAVNTNIGTILKNAIDENKNSNWRVKSSAPVYNPKHHLLPTHATNCKEYCQEWTSQ